MQSENLHIDEFVRQKEAEWTPDHSQQDVHWEKMTSMLVKPSGPVPQKRVYTSRRIIRYLGGFAIVTAITIITYTATKSKKNTTTKTVTSKTAIAPVKRLPQKNYAPGAAANAPLPASITSNSSTPVHNITPPAKPAAEYIKDGLETAATATPDAATLLNDFYKRIEKPAQEFYVQTARDTMLIAREGTRLSIPSNTFSGQSGKIKNGVVKIVLTEYYKYDDMAAAKLNTTSNGLQLITGGMVHIRAFADGEELKVAPKKNIELAMPTSNYDKRMRMFTGNVIGSQNVVAGLNRQREDTVAFVEAGAYARSGINWVLSGDPIASAENINEGKDYIEVLDLSVEPHRVSYGNNTKAKFLVNRDIDLSNEEIKEELKKRYGTYYDKIKIRRVSRRNRSSYIDSTVMSFEAAVRLKLVSKQDSIRRQREFEKSRGFKPQQNNYDTLRFYRFTTSSLGWINCDRFGNNLNNIYFTLNLGEGYDAGHFQSQLIFTRYRSIMGGNWQGSKIQFGNIPANEPVQLITVGVKDGKIVSCIQSITTSDREVSGLVFEETSPGEFRKKLESLNLIR